MRKVEVHVLLLSVVLFSCGTVNVQQTPPAPSPKPAATSSPASQPVVKIAILTASPAVVVPRPPQTLLVAFERIRALERLIEVLRKKYCPSLPLYLVHGLICAESRGICTLINKKGDFGCLQILHRTAVALGLKVITTSNMSYEEQVAALKALVQSCGGDARCVAKKDERADPEKAVAAAVRYLCQLHKRFRNWNSALSAYNRGPTGLRRSAVPVKIQERWARQHAHPHEYVRKVRMYQSMYNWLLLRKSTKPSVLKKRWLAHVSKQEKKEKGARRWVERRIRWLREWKERQQKRLRQLKKKRQQKIKKQRRLRRNGGRKMLAKKSR